MSEIYECLKTSHKQLDREVWNHISTQTITNR